MKKLFKNIWHWLWALIIIAAIVFVVWKYGQDIVNLIYYSSNHRG